MNERLKSGSEIVKKSYKSPILSGISERVKIVSCPDVATVIRDV
jgi:hypothetical protein